MPISAAPSATLKTTTDGTTASDSARKGLAGMNRPRKSKGLRCSTRLVLKKLAASQSGKASGVTNTAKSVNAQSTSRKPPARLASATASLALRPPRPCTSDTAMYGSTVICSSRMKAWPTLASTAMRSPKKSPAATPSTRPMRMRVARFMGGFRFRVRRRAARGARPRRVRV